VDPYLAEEKVHINFLLATLDLRKTMDMPFIEKKNMVFTLDMPFIAFMLKVDPFLDISLVKGPLCYHETSNPLFQNNIQWPRKRYLTSQIRRF
jgi:hypothetical protein